MGRQIANVLVANEKKKYEALLQRNGQSGMANGNNENYQMMQMRKEIERMKQIMSQTLAENDSLKKSKKNLEKMVVNLSKYCTNCKQAMMCVRVSFFLLFY